jgi:hypothetical protein
MQHGVVSGGRPDFEEELMALMSIYDSELNVERRSDGSVSLQMKMSPAPPAYIKASVSLHIPAAVRTRPLVASVTRQMLAHRSAGSIVADTACTVRYIQSAPLPFELLRASPQVFAGGSRELTAQLQQRIDVTLMRQLRNGEPMCFQAFVDAQEWLEDNNRYVEDVHCFNRVSLCFVWF